MRFLKNKDLSDRLARELSRFEAAEDPFFVLNVEEFDKL